MLRLERPEGIEGEIKAPPDKSISHRGVILSLIAGQGEIEGISHSQDMGRSLSFARALGGELKGKKIFFLRRKFFTEPQRPLYAGNSGTTVRLFMGLLSSLPFFSIVYGDESLSRRPMRRVIEPLSRMGARIEGREDGEALPLAIRGGSLKGIEYELPIPSAQVKSALLLAALFAEGKTVVKEKIPSRDHTERMLELLGAKIKRDFGKIELFPSPLSPLKVKVPGDFSSASYLLSLAILHPRARVKIKDVGLNPTRIGFLNILKEMGAKVEVEMRERFPEPLGDIYAESSQLRGVEVGKEIIPSCIDELPLLAVVATQAEGVMKITGAKELRFKETDRIKAIVTELRRMGARAEELEDGLVVKGPVSLKGNLVHAHQDHRIALSLAVACLVAQGESKLSGESWITISYPEFFDHLKEVIK